MGRSGHGGGPFIDTGRDWAQHISATSLSRRGTSDSCSRHLTSNLIKEGGRRSIVIPFPPTPVRILSTTGRSWEPLLVAEASSQGEGAMGSDSICSPSYITCHPRSWSCGAAPSRHLDIRAAGPAWYGLSRREAGTRAPERTMRDGSGTSLANSMSQVYPQAAGTGVALIP
jgi:hypothetical protein